MVDADNRLLKLGYDHRRGSPTRFRLLTLLPRAGAMIKGSLIKIALHPLALVAGLGIVIRVALAPLTSWTWDVAPFFVAAMDISSGNSPYHSMFYTYPPGWAYTFAFPMLLLSAFASPGTLGVFVPSMVEISRFTGMISPLVTAPIFNLVLKLPLIVSDFVTGVLLYRIVSGLRNLELARRAFTIWFLNPLVILVGSIHGQFDVLPSMFVVASVYFISKRDHLFAGSALAISIGYKLFAIYLVPAYLVWFIMARPRDARSFPIKSPLALFAVGFVLTSALVAFIFSWETGLVALLRRFDTLSFGGFTPLSVLWPVDFSRATAVITPLLVASTLVSVVAMTWLVLRRGAAKSHSLVIPTLTTINVLAIFLIYSLSPTTNPQYLLWILPHMIVLGYWKRERQWPAALVSTFGVAFLVALMGPLVYLYPASVWLGVPHTSVINGSVLAYWSFRGLTGDYLWRELIGVIAWLGYAVLLVQAGISYASLRKDLR